MSITHTAGHHPTNAHLLLHWAPSPHQCTSLPLGPSTILIYQSTCFITMHTTTITNIHTNAQPQYCAPITIHTCNMTSVHSHQQTQRVTSGRHLHV
ncbi:hypothetical protein Pmani_009603 [Petrolisthes manimaculis]|uniref:Uncharacterized protein n=1 Tax=Petrolisthes manimaculis TaxID=1843537 RepID=A0AAE1UCP9_9EUCA|nr:hypothetical protein Pmani_009603 [Petrolisthes manimaculis]